MQDTLKIWGCRGSVPQTSMSKKKYGLETSCISLEINNELFVIDAGSGIRSLCNYIESANKDYRKINIFLTHYHHDHISGLAFTKFIFKQKNKTNIYGPSDVYKILGDYFSAPYFPVKLVDLHNVTTENIESGQKLQFDNLEIETISLVHPQGSLGYKLKAHNKTICIITDYEYNLDKNKKAVEQFIKDCDYLIMDTFFKQEDYIETWGHSTIQEGICLKEKLNIKNCILYHHNANYTDDILDKEQTKINSQYKNIRFAQEGMEIKLV